MGDDKGMIKPSHQDPNRIRGFVFQDGQRYMANEYAEGSYCVDDSGQKFRRVKTQSNAAGWMPILETVPGVENPDPINRPLRGISQADMGPMPTYPVDRPPVVGTYDVGAQMKEADGPNYAAVDYGDEQQSDDSFWIRLSHSADLIPDRTQSILQNQVPTALRSFIRQNLEYHNTDQALGYQGQFAEIYHITATLKRLMWDSNFTGKATNVAIGEIQEQLESLIGHALLALDLLEAGNKNGR